MDTDKCSRCGSIRGKSWESGDIACSGHIRLNACSRIHDSITGGHTNKVESPFYIDMGFQAGEFRWGSGTDAKLCWGCNVALMGHIGKFFLDVCAPAQEEKEMEKVCKKHQVRSLQGEPCGSCAADLRERWDRAFFVVLGAGKGVTMAQAHAEDAIRRHADMMASRDKLIAEVVG